MTDRGSIRTFDVMTTTTIKEPQMSPSVSTLLAPRPDTTADIAARAVDATKIYGRGDTAVRALDDVTVEFQRGRFTAIMGPSGSGKSTLMHCVAGLDTLTAGQVFIGDTDLSAPQREAAHPAAPRPASASSSRRSTWCRR